MASPDDLKDKTRILVDEIRGLADSAQQTVEHASSPVDTYVAWQSLLLRALELFEVVSSGRREDAQTGSPGEDPPAHRPIEPKLDPRTRDLVRLIQLVPDDEHGNVHHLVSALHSLRSEGVISDQEPDYEQLLRLLGAEFKRAHTWEWMYRAIRSIFSRNSDDILTGTEKLDPRSQLMKALDEADRLIEEHPPLSVEAEGHRLLQRFRSVTEALPADPDSQPTETPLSTVPKILPEAQRRRPASVLWIDRNKSKFPTPPDFIRKFYGSRIGKGFTQADLAAADKSLYRALQQWLQMADKTTGQRNVMPADLYLPTLEEWNARLLSLFERDPTQFSPAERVRLLQVKAARERRALMGRDIMRNGAV